MPTVEEKDERRYVQSQGKRKHLINELVQMSMLFSVVTCFHVSFATLFAAYTCIDIAGFHFASLLQISRFD